MIARTRVARLLKGYRGDRPGDSEALTKALVSLSTLSRQLGDCIESVAISPFIVRPAEAGAFALDGRVMSRP